MDDGPDSLPLRYLRRIDEKLDNIAADVRELKQRMGFVEESLASVSRRTDRLDDRLDRIDRRLNLG